MAKLLSGGEKCRFFVPRSVLTEIRVEKVRRKETRVSEEEKKKVFISSFGPRSKMCFSHSSALVASLRLSVTMCVFSDDDETLTVSGSISDGHAMISVFLDPPVSPHTTKKMAELRAKGVYGSSQRLKVIIHERGKKKKRSQAKNNTTNLLDQSCPSRCW